LNVNLLLQVASNVNGYQRKIDSPTDILVHWVPRDEFDRVLIQFFLMAK
jgi:hypothetical protein